MRPLARFQKIFCREVMGVISWRNAASSGSVGIMLGKVTHSFSRLFSPALILFSVCLKGDVTNDTVSQLNFTKAMTCFSPSQKKREKKEFHIIPPVAQQTFQPVLVRWLISVLLAWSFLIVVTPYLLLHQASLLITASTVKPLVKCELCAVNSGYKPKPGVTIASDWLCDRFGVLVATGELVSRLRVEDFTSKVRN